MSIATVCLSGGLGEKLEAVAAAGFKEIEIFENDLLSFDGKPADVRKRAHDLGININTFQPFRDFEGLPPERRVRALARAERKFDLMQELGCGLMLVCSNCAADSIGGIDRAAADLHDLGERAKARDIRIGYEALAWGRHVNDYRDSWEAVRRASHDSVGIILDSFHILARKTDLGVIRSIPRDRIFLVQIADAPMLTMDYLSWARHFRNFPGQGDFPLLDFMMALDTTGYDGVLSLEIFNDQFRAGSPRSLALDGHRSLINLMDQLNRKRGRVADGSVQLPPRAPCLGTEFIEFSVAGGNAPAFEKLLSGLGFLKAGQHVSKSVSRWTQGAINIVLNAETEGFAHAFGVTHGTSVCALGLRVTDAQATLARATGLLDNPFHQAVRKGELDVPAVRGLGGSLVYFVDPQSELAKVWEIEFRPVAAGTRDAGAGLTAIDHISQSMHYEELLTWLLFYTSLLELDKTPEQDVLDPGGLVKSQVVQSADGALRIVLNASQSSRTQSSRFLSEAFGSGVQHIAFATNDIFKTAQAFKASGVVLLEIPENYYDDLEAKIDIDPELLAQLQSHNVMYDRDENDGEFFQMYTQSFDERFFFEIVERRNYKGFGAGNAQVRLTAQARQARAPGMPRL